MRSHLFRPHDSDERNGEDDDLVRPGGDLTTTEKMANPAPAFPYPYPRPWAHPRVSGHTLVEAAVALTVLGVLLGSAVPRMADLRDRLAVRSAREAVVGIFSRARRRAVLVGGSELVLSESRQSVVLRGARDADAAIGAEFGVELDVAGSEGEVALVFGPLGLGRFASRTLTLRRGDATARLIVSSYGRIRRR